MPQSPRVAQPGPAHSGFNRAPLVRWLEGLGGAEVAASKQTFAERVSPWLDWTDAIALSAALADGSATEPATASVAAVAAVASAASAAFGVPDPALATVGAAVDRARSELARAIVADRVFAGDAGEPEPASSLRSRFQAHQRAMAACIAPLRAELRAALSRQSPALAKLAALDAVLDKALAAHERRLLAGVPGLLDQHFDGPHLQRALLAELALRLQPVEGLLQALNAAPGAVTAPAT